jgi:NDP-sugar pyrophosphorylase family protein
MNAIILAGGLGKRLRPFTETIPKPLLPIGEKSILQIQIENLVKHGFEDIILATNYKADYIENFFGDGSRLGARLKISKEEKPLGTAGPLTLLKDHLAEPFLVMNGDILTSMNYRKLYDFALEKDALLTVAVKEILTPFQFGNIFFDGDYVTGIEEKPDIKTNILAGIYIMNPDIFRFIPDDQYYGMDTLIHDMIRHKEPIIRYQLKEYWLDIGNIEDYNKAQDIYEQHFKG